MPSFQRFACSNRAARQSCRVRPGLPGLVVLYCFGLLIVDPVRAQVVLDGEGWPRQFELDGAKVTIYQPQTESFAKDRVEGRAAFSVTPDSKGPLFGAMWFGARAITDTEERLIRFTNFAVQDIKFPEGDDEKIEGFRVSLNEKFSGLDITMALDRFLADLPSSEGGAAANVAYRNEAPVLLFETEAAVLVLIDGEPILADTQGGDFKYVVNTAYFIAQDPSQGRFYLKGGKWWYESADVGGQWSPVTAPPSGISSLADQLFTGDAGDEDMGVGNLVSPPKIIVSTVPAELIVTTGEPDFRSVEGTELLYWDNSESDVLMDISTNMYYVLVSGRWFRSDSLTTEDWAFVPSDDLPESFSSIPQDSSVASVRVSVAGTQEAREAILGNTIPQTAEIDRKTATADVSYDGAPEFAVIDGTEVQYAINADKQVLKINERFYLVDDGVWFESSRATGLWVVSTEVPDEVNNIPPGSPVYSVKYVYIYDYTPEVVYVGYTPGYYGSYVYSGTVIYGTGYYYDPWYRSYYYPRPVTYGFGVHYNPYTGWGFSLGVSFGWLNIGISTGGWGYWGNSGYRYGYRHGYYHGARHGYYAGRRNGYVNGYAAGRTSGYRATARNTQYSRYAASNAYTRRATGVNRSTARTTAAASTARATSSATNLSNNVYSDRNGDIYRRDSSGNWQQRSNGDWSTGAAVTGGAAAAGAASQRSTASAGSSYRSSYGSSAQRSSQQNLNRSYDARSRGTQRTQAYRSTRPSGGRGGGGRRR